MELNLIEQGSDVIVCLLSQWIELSLRIIDGLVNVTCQIAAHLDFLGFCESLVSLDGFAFGL